MGKILAFDTSFNEMENLVQRDGFWQIFPACLRENGNTFKLSFRTKTHKCNSILSKFDCIGILVEEIRVLLLVV